MLEIKSFKFNPFEENTYLLINEKKEAFIIDPGAYFPDEQQTLLDYLSSQQIQPVRLLNTHCHLDHIFGNALIFKHFGLQPEFHRQEQAIFAGAADAAARYNMPMEASPAPQGFIEVDSILSLGTDHLSVLLAPGHSPGSICFYAAEQQLLLGGDVLFRESIGRSDLPGGNADDLVKSIRETLYALPDETVVYPGHGPKTTIGHEKQHNPFVRP